MSEESVNKYKIMWDRLKEVLIFNSKTSTAICYDQVYYMLLKLMSDIEKELKE